MMEIWLYGNLLALILLLIGVVSFTKEEDKYLDVEGLLCSLFLICISWLGVIILICYIYSEISEIFSFEKWWKRVSKKIIFDWRK